MKTALPCYYHLDVEVSPERIEQVSRILAAHLRHWGLETLADRVCHCVGVLLRAVEENGSDKNTGIEMWWTGQHLITAVSDNEPDLPDPHYGPQGCLAQIAALSDGWGNYPATHGKIIWFSHRARSHVGARLRPVTPAPTLREARPEPRTVPVAVLTGAADPHPCLAAAASASAGAGRPPGHVLP
ncbi:pep a2 [Streptomyces longispororuber]|uniref:pep a2 n=1 Tax=Streptomyces TaxID=1883 RepID=UPI0024A9E62F|nr:pep a2 [Streptomyces sp. CC224B]